MDKFKKDYQPRTNFVQDENGDLPADSHNILNRWKDNSSQLLNINGVSDVRQRETHKGESLQLQPSPFEVEIAIGNSRHIISIHFIPNFIFLLFLLLPLNVNFICRLNYWESSVWIST
jgi:hypothetical protein